MIFNYHQITKSQDPYRYAVTIDQLERHLLALTRDQEIKAFEITFDDGHITQLRNGVPILQKLGCSATFFVTLGWVNVDPDYFTWDDIAELRRLGYPVGTHGWSHRFLTQCSPQELKKELDSSKKELEDHLGAAVTSMSLPGGRFNRAVLASCLEAGYSAVYTSDAWHSDNSGPVKVYGRLVVTREMTESRILYLQNCGGKEPMASRAIGMGKKSAKKVLGDNLYYRIWSVLTRNPRIEGMDGAA